jgi:hypothetical protein
MMMRFIQLLLLTTLCTYANAGRLSFFTFGDFGKESDMQEKVSQAMNARAKTVKDVTFCLTLGDNFYDSVPQKVSDGEFEDVFEDEYDLNMRYYIILGNHDVATKTEMQTEVDYTFASNVPDWTGRWFLPSRYYSFRKTFKAQDGKTDVYVDFVIADTSMLLDVGTGSSSSARQKQWQWLESTLTNSAKTANFIVGT